MAQQQRNSLFRQARLQLSRRFSSFAFAISEQAAWLSAWIHHIAITGSVYPSSSGLFHPVGASSSTIFKSNEPGPSYPDIRLSLPRRHRPHQIVYFLMLVCLLVCRGAAQTDTPSPTASPSTPCAAGWSYYSDSDASEGQASCLAVTGAATLNWLTAMRSCPMNSHLLTMAGMSPGSGLYAFSRVVSTASFWVGTSQSGTATAVNRGWNWIDGTPGGSLNCGAPGDQGCGLWLNSSGTLEPTLVTVSQATCVIVCTLKYSCVAWCCVQ